MSSKSINIVLIVLITLILIAMAFFAFRLWSEWGASQGPDDQMAAGIVVGNEVPKTYDALMESGIRNISDAVRVYAVDHGGNYPVSKIENPCAGVQYCLKGADINTNDKAYLATIPQTDKSHIDYYYRSNNEKKTYCVKSPTVLATDSSSVFQCTQAECGKTPFKDACEQ